MLKNILNKILMLALVFPLFLLVFGCKKEAEVIKALEPLPKNTIVTLDGRSNTLYFLDTETKTFLDRTFSFANSEKYETQSLALAPNGKLYIPVNTHYDFSAGNASPFMAVIDVKNSAAMKEIKTDMLPQYVGITSNGKAYMTHAFEYEDGSGWAVSVYDTNTDTFLKTLKIPGAPDVPIVFVDKVYLPVAGGGKEHFGSSNIVVINSENDENELFFPENFTEVPPQTVQEYNDTLLALVEGVHQSKTTAFRKLPYSGYEHFFVKSDLNNKEVISINEIPIKMSSATRFVVYENRAYIAYFDATSGVGGGLMVYDLDKNEVIKDIDLDDRVFDKNILLFNGQIYLTDTARKSILIMDANTLEFYNVAMPSNASPDALVAY